MYWGEFNGQQRFVIHGRIPNFIAGLVRDHPSNVLFSNSPTHENTLPHSLTLPAIMDYNVNVVVHALNHNVPCYEQFNSALNACCECGLWSMLCNML